MLTGEQIEQLFSVATISAPREMCGLLFPGKPFYQTHNTAKHPEHEFLIDHLEYLKACMIHDGKPWAIVHSHATKGAGPSVKDCRLMDALAMTNHDLAMVIVGLRPREIRCFKKREHCYELQWAYTQIHGEWWGPGLGDVVTIERCRFVEATDP